jgi:hypothetical protein
MDGKRIVQIASRQIIYLPNHEDLEGFYAQDLEWARPENLVTIVTEREFDRQLINMVMTRAMGITLAPTPLKPRPALAAARYTPARAEADFAYQRPEEGKGPHIPPGLEGGATTLEGFLAYLKNKYRPNGDAGATARSQLPLRYKIEF